MIRVSEREVGGVIKKLREPLPLKKRTTIWGLQNKNGHIFEFYECTRTGAKRVVRVATREADEIRGNKLDDIFGENRRIFWKEMMRVKRREHVN